MYSAGCGRSCSMYNPCQYSRPSWSRPARKGSGRYRTNDAAALLDGAGGDDGAGQVVQVAREFIVAPPPPSLHEPLPHRGLTFGTRTAFSPR